MALGVGFCFIALQGLAYLGFIEIKWSNITGTGIKVLDTNGDGKLDGEDVSKYLRNLLFLLTVSFVSKPKICN